MTNSRLYRFGIKIDNLLKQQETRTQKVSPLEVMEQDVTKIINKVTTPIAKGAYNFIKGLTAEQMCSFFNANGLKVNENYLKNTPDSLVYWFGVVAGAITDISIMSWGYGNNELSDVYITTKIATNLGSLTASGINKWYQSAKKRAENKPTESQ